MDLIELDATSEGLDIALVYAGTNNLLGRAVYTHPHCYLHRTAADKLFRARDLAARLGLRLRLWDALRPAEAQAIFWAAFPQEGFFTPPQIGSPHSRGVAVDLTLLDSDGQMLEMGTGFDDPSPVAWHGAEGISAKALTNRSTLLGLMSAAGWDFYQREWWHYQLFAARTYPLWSDSALPRPMISGA